jgi:hypothetical protein
VSPDDVSPDEEQQLRTLGQALEIVPGWVTLTGSPPPQLVAGSNLAYDDRRAHPYQVSHAVWAAMSAGVSHLAALRDSLFHATGPDRVEAKIHTHGQFSLVRGALENASRAIWMLEPNDADKRLLRRLRLEWAESSEQAQVRELMGTPPGKSKDDQLKTLTDLLPPATADPDQINAKQKAIKERPDYRTIVKVAGSHVSSGSSIQLFVWKACSALAHGDFRGTLGYTEREVLPGSTPGIAMARITGSVSLLAYGSLVAIETMKVALKFYGKRAA